MDAVSIPFNNTHSRVPAIPKDRLAGFNELILQYQDAAYNFSYYLLGDPDTAEDVTQQAFINAYLHFDSFHGEHFRSWLFKIIKNACFDELRRQKRHRAFSLDDLDSNDSNEPEWDHLTARPISPEQFVEQSDSALRIEAALCRMDEIFRTVLILVDIQEMDYQEVCQILGIPLGTVKSRLARARQQLRALLNNNGI